MTSYQNVFQIQETLLLIITIVLLFLKLKALKSHRHYVHRWSDLYAHK